MKMQGHDSLDILYKKEEEGKKKKPLDFTKISAIVLAVLPVLPFVTFEHPLSVLPPPVCGYDIAIIFLGMLAAYFCWTKEKFMLVLFISIFEFISLSLQFSPPYLLNILSVLNIILIVSSYGAFVDVS